MRSPIMCPIKDQLQIPDLLYRTPGPLYKLPPSSMGLDITRCSDRLFLMSRWWTHPSDTSSARNNVNDLVKWCQQALARHKFIIWRLGSSAGDSHPALSSAVNLGLPPHTTPTLKLLLDLCRSMAAWLALDMHHVAIIQCKNGKSRSMLAMSCFLMFIGAFDSTQDAFDWIQATALKEHKELGLGSVPGKREPPPAPVCPLADVPAVPAVL